MPRIVLLIFVAIGAVSQPTHAEPAASPPLTDIAGARSAAMQNAIDVWASAPGHRGVSASVIHGDGEQWTGVAGMESADSAMRPEHLLWIASITKSMTGAVILGLAETGKLGLDDPIHKWMGEIENVDPEITIRQLLNHTNGIANYTASPELNTAIQADTSRIFSAPELIGFIGPKNFERGERTQYTNSAFVLLGMVAEAASGKAIQELYHERLWDPLKLDDIFLPGLEEPTGPIAQAWLGRGPDESHDPLDMMSLMTIGNSAFGLYSNAATVARWGRALFTNRVFGEEMREQMLQFVPAAGNIQGESGAGLGIRKYAYLGREQWGHSGGAPLGSSLMLYDPDTEVTVVVIMNQGRGAGHFLLAPELLEIATTN